MLVGILQHCQVAPSSCSLARAGAPGTAALMGILQNGQMASSRCSLACA